MPDLYISHYLNVPEGSIDDAHFVFHLSIIAAALNTMLVPYQGLLVAYEKFSASATIDIIANLIKRIYAVLVSVSGFLEIKHLYYSSS